MKPAAYILATLAALTTTINLRPDVPLPHSSNPPAAVRVRPAAAPAPPSGAAAPTCTASTYGWGEPLNTHTASGQVFDPDGMTAAMWDIPLGTHVTVTAPTTGRTITVTINDRGPARRLHRCIDLARGAWEALGLTRPGLTAVTLTHHQ